MDLEFDKKRELELNKRIEIAKKEKIKKIEEERRLKIIEEKRKEIIQNKFIQNKLYIKEVLESNEKSKLTYLQKLDPYDFEKIVAKMFELNGYLAKVTSKSNDGGKDIFLQKNNKIYLVECKRYNDKNKVGREALQKFFAAIIEEKAEGGYFITTSDFTSTAYEYPKAIDNKIKLINGEKLTKAMISVFPQNNSFLKNYTEVCLECGEFVIFSYPNIKKSNCTNGHIVLSTIEKIVKEL